MEAIVKKLDSEGRYTQLQNNKSYNCWQFATMRSKFSNVPNDCAQKLQAEKKKKTFQTIEEVIKEAVEEANYSQQAPQEPSWYHVAVCYKVDSQTPNGYEVHFIREFSDGWFGKPSSKVDTAYEATVTITTVKQKISDSKEQTYTLLGQFYVRCPS